MAQPPDDHPVRPRRPRSSKARFARFRARKVEPPAPGRRTSPPARAVSGASAAAPEGAAVPDPPEVAGVARVWRWLRRRGPQHRSAGSLLVAFLRLLPPHLGWLSLALCALTLSTLVGLVLPATPKLAIDYVLTDAPGPAGLRAALHAWLPEGWPAALADAGASLASLAPAMEDDREIWLWVLAAAGVIASLASLVIDVAGRYALLRVSKRLAVRFRRQVFEHAVQLPLWRVQALKSGGVASLLRNDAGAPAELVTQFLYTPWRAAVQLCVSLGILAWVDAWLLAGALVLLPVVWFTHAAWIAKLRPLWRGVRDTREGIDAHATEVFGGMRVVRAFAREPSEALRFATGTHLMTRQEVWAWWWSRGVEIGWRILVPFVGAFVLLYGGARVLEGRLTIGDLVLFVSYTSMMLGPLESLVGSAASIQSGLAAFERVLDLLDEPIEGGRQGRARPAELRGAVSLEHVRFAYPGSDAEVLHGIDLEVAAGEVIALVGRSGAGKTTLTNLIAGFYPPTDGRLCIDGTDIRELDLLDLRRGLGVVEQDVFLFDGTIFDNIAYARRGATLDDVKRAATQACADEFIAALAQGYDTEIGERGVRLSGGQKQRIALARAILKDPRILILDEATSNLDSQSEALIQQSLAALMRGRTAFVIAHRLSTIRHADRIVVLEQGRVVEQGTHEELLARGGAYATLLAAQLASAR